MISKITKLVKLLIGVILLLTLALLWTCSNITNLEDDVTDLSHNMNRLQSQVKDIQITLDEHIEAPTRVECPD